MQIFVVILKRACGAENNATIFLSDAELNVNLKINTDKCRTADGALHNEEVHVYLLAWRIPVRCLSSPMAPRPVMRYQLKAELRKT